MVHISSSRVLLRSREPGRLPGRRIPLQKVPSRPLTVLAADHSLSTAQEEALHSVLRCAYASRARQPEVVMEVAVDAPGTAPDDGGTPSGRTASARTSA
ncbi:hypothetical protein ABZ760_12425 [Streptomyces sp. NPDC006658]|uniref:hypothetical protein n=1 Tax=Streptomyces sp. NPDC006658 TaxID=3156900 RepID=UPI0033F9C707